MARQKTLFQLDSADATADLAADLAPQLARGDTLLLEGPVGAGKTHFARHLIQALQDDPEDIPSPTFTLVQVYDTPAGEIWHADLYRITSPFEIEELGLVDAFETAICLVEWPDRLGELAPPDALRLTFADGATEQARLLTACWANDRWTQTFRKWMGL